MRARQRADGHISQEPVRSTCVSTARTVGGDGGPLLCAPQHPWCSVVGCCAGRRHGDRDRLCLRRRLRRQRAGPGFGASFVVECIFAVLAVRQTGIFTAVIQPPLILFVAVPTAYFLFHGSQITAIKDTLIDYGYPLIERFPLMFFTSAAVLLIGIARWYYGMSTRRAAPRPRQRNRQAPASRRRCRRC